MKIFNWVHKRFHHTTPKDGFASNVKSVEPTISDADSQALMKQDALADLLGGWKEGILTIGTLGCDPLKPLNQSKKEYYALEIEGDEVEEDDEEHVLVEEGDIDEDNYKAEHEVELNPLMQTTFEHNFEDLVSANHDSTSSNKLAVVTPPPVISHEAIESNEVETDQLQKKEGERITLADLFYADSDVKMKLDPATKVLLQTSEKTSTLKAKHGLSFTKMLIPRVKGNPQPIEDIKKLMKKMLKRKIHPELDVENDKPEGSAAGVSEDNDKHEANDTASLLPI